VTVSADEWRPAGRLEDLKPGEALVVELDPPIAVWNVDGQLYATDDTCSHAESSLGGEGWLQGDVVECSFHWAKFCVRDGSVKAPPAHGPLRTYRVMVDDGVIYVDPVPQA
jgi:3-phenylpropionate/trans-cinnamate dioxygenase ferredoxin component